MQGTFKSRWLGCLLVVWALPAPAGEAPPIKDWIRGPVRYISLKEEARTFKQLGSDEDRALFIERFWRRRDPTPETLTNEYRQVFWERVQQANANFIDSPKKGWLTDRGKIYILYGPPTETQSDVHLNTQGLPAAGRGLIRWIYEGRPGQRMDLDPTVVVPFVRDASGEYRVSYEPKLTSIFFDANAIHTKEDAQLDRFFSLVGSPRNSQLSVMLDLGRMQEVPPQELVLLERVETAEAFLTHELVTSLQRYYEPGRDGAVVSITVDLSGSTDENPPAIIARFEPFDATLQPRLLGEGSFRIEGDAASRVAQGRLRLAPGSYTLTVLVADPQAVRTGLARQALEIPERSDRPRFSEVILASRLDSLPYASLSGYQEPFIVGPFRVVPLLGSEVHRGEAVRLFYEVYGAKQPLTVSYLLEGQETDGSWVAVFGKPSKGRQSAASQAWELTTGLRWPLGAYRILVEVVDADGRLISTRVPFTLTEAEPH